jgi:hypothetical protein
MRLFYFSNSFFYNVSNTDFHIFDSLDDCEIERDSVRDEARACGASDLAIAAGISDIRELTFDDIDSHWGSLENWFRALPDRQSERNRELAAVVGV